MFFLLLFPSPPQLGKVINYIKEAKIESVITDFINIHYKYTV